ncbi:MAG: glutamate racemase [Proteobacteria bacterium]|nr:glutamate racemase [Pseudomonadota bacterium]MBU1736551.1 glutamate racemase [Pseudomonadota bacterium]
MIGIFDSGVGGMTVARALENRLPGVPYIYFGDLARAPYGPKSPETITEYARENTRFLIEQGARLIVIACNSAASVAADLIKAEFPVPVFEVIGPAVKEAVAASRSGRIGVIGTRATVRSNVYDRKIAAAAPEARVFSTACPLLVPLVEEGWFNRRETKMIVRSYLHSLKLKKVDTLVLGCTHYPLLRQLIQPRIGKNVRIIDSSDAVAAELADFLAANPSLAAKLETGESSRYYASDITEAARATAKSIFGRRIEMIKL